MGIPRLVCLQTTPPGHPYNFLASHFCGSRAGAQTCLPVSDWVHLGELRQGCQEGPQEETGRSNLQTPHHSLAFPLPRYCQSWGKCDGTLWILIHTPRGRGVGVSVFDGVTSTHTDSCHHWHRFYQTHTWAYLFFSTKLFLFF